MNILTIIRTFIMSLFKKKNNPNPPVMPSSVSPTVAVINESTVLTDQQLTPIIQALQIQCNRDFGPIWNVTCVLVQIFKGQKAPATAWQLVVADNSDQAGALGYHDITAQGNPVAFVFAKTDQQYGASTSVTMSHELLEMLGDSGVDLSAQSDNTHFWAYEVGDPVQADAIGYDINGVLVSDFVTPYFFMSPAPAGVKMDFKNVLSQPFTIAPGGYANIWDPTNGWSQQTNGEVKEQSRVEKRQ